LRVITIDRSEQRMRRQVTKERELTSADRHLEDPRERQQHSAPTLSATAAMVVDTLQQDAGVRYARPLWSQAARWTAQVERNASSRLG
jgi:hypothetical protein